jgi:SAM-dependent methyltransferase
MTPAPGSGAAPKAWRSRGMHPIYRVYAAVSPYFRRKRMAELLRFARFAPGDRVLDVGGLPWFWEGVPLPCRITLLNLKNAPGMERHTGRFDLVEGDATRLPYPDGAFDVAISNSVIEHVGSWENQQRFAAEIRRVARRLWVQTPARAFLVEPHLLAPAIHWLPRAAQRRLIRRFSLWGLFTRPDRARVDAFLDEVRLLNYAEMRELFPDCEIRRERVLGWTKSYVAVRGADGPPSPAGRTPAP